MIDIDKLKKDIVEVFEKYDNNLDRKDFSNLISKIIIEEYGEHNYQKILNDIKLNLDKEKRKDNHISEI